MIRRRLCFLRKQKSVVSTSLAVPVLKNNILYQRKKKKNNSTFQKLYSFDHFEAYRLKSNISR